MSLEEIASKLDDQTLYKRRHRLLSKQPVNWSFIDLMRPLPWENAFTVTNPFVVVPGRTLMPEQPPFYAGNVRPREDEIPERDEYDRYYEHRDQRQRPDSPPPGPPPPQPSIPINLNGSMTGTPGEVGNQRNPRIRHPAYERGNDVFYRGSSLPQNIYMPLSGQQAQRPTYGAAREA